MTARLDAVQLDRVWDASVLGEPLPLPIDDLDETRLLELLAETARSAPAASFVRSLERELALTGAGEGVVAPPSVKPMRKPRTIQTDKRWWRRPPSRWMTAGYALAAIALIALLSSFAIARQRNGDDNGPSIPAVSEWTEAGPPTSPGVKTTPLFAHTFSADELAGYSFDRWGWVQFMRGTVEPGDSSHSIDGSAEADTMSHPGVSFIEVERGQLTARLAKPALIGDRSSSERLAQVPAGTDVTLEAGETLVFGLGALSKLGNPTDSVASYVAGGLYVLPDYPINFPNSTQSDDIHTGISFDATVLAGADSVDVTIDRVSIGPGETFAYAITPQTLLLANVTGDGLTKQAWSNLAPVGDGQSVLASMYSLHEDEPGYYTLTNTSSERVDVYFQKVSPPGSVQPAPDATFASVNTIFEQAFSQPELTPYRPDEWGWIELLHETELDPGQQWPVIDGSNGTPTPGWPGLSVVGIDSGALTARLSKPVLVCRAGSGTMEEVPAPAELVLQAGDAFVFETGAVESVWNLGGTRAEFVAGGLYDRPHYPTQHTGTGILDTPGGSSFDSAVLLAGSLSLDLSIRKISIAPGQNYRYTITPQTLLLADVRGEGLQKTTLVDGTPGDESQRLLVSKYALHNDSPGEYILTNTGQEPVDVYLFEVEAQGAPGTAVQPRFRINDWM